MFWHTNRAPNYKVENMFDLLPPLIRSFGDVEKYNAGQECNSNGYKSKQ